MLEHCPKPCHHCHHHCHRSEEVAVVIVYHHRHHHRGTVARVAVVIVLQLGIDRHVTIRSLTPLLHNSMMMMMLMMTMISIIIIIIIVNIQIIIIDMWPITLLLQNLILVMIAMTGKVFDHQNIPICICTDYKSIPFPYCLHCLLVSVPQLEQQYTSSVLY